MARNGRKVQVNGEHRTNRCNHQNSYNSQLNKCFADWRQWYARCTHSKFSRSNRQNDEWICVWNINWTCVGKTSGNIRQTTDNGRKRGDTQREIVNGEQGKKRIFSTQMSIRHNAQYRENIQTDRTDIICPFLFHIESTNESKKRREKNTEWRLTVWMAAAAGRQAGRTYVAYLFINCINLLPGVFGSVCFVPFSVVFSSFFIRSTSSPSCICACVRCTVSVFGGSWTLVWWTVNVSC